MSILEKIKKQAEAISDESLTIRVPKTQPREVGLTPHVSGVRRDSLGRVLPGSPSPNPKGGRAGALANKLYEATNGLDEVKEVMISIMRGNLTVVQMTATGELVEIGPSIKDRMEAAKWIVDRTAGKAADIIKVEATVGDFEANRVDPSLLKPEELADLLDLTARILDRQQNQVVEGEVTLVLAEQAGNIPSENEG